MSADVQERVERHLPGAQAVAEAIHGYAETAGEEHRSAQALTEWLEANGFAVERGLGSQPTAFRARKGEGTPAIAFLCEYDALPGLAWEGGRPVPERPGHGCGHNLLGAGSALAAIALAEAMEAENHSGSVLVYGTPAEETLYGKTCLRREGYFRDLDAVLTWHPLTMNRAGEMQHKAMHSVVCEYHGKSAHASVCPEQGRSALDACELMNIGVNYLREHVPGDVRMHYGYTDAGGAPNVVPAQAAVWYFLRAGRRGVADEVLARVHDIARGAALMTGTTVESRVLASTDHTRINHTLAALAHAHMVALGGSDFTPEEVARAAAFAGEAGLSGALRGDVLPLAGHPIEEHGSTDFSDVSQVAPSLEIFTACFLDDTPNHHWTVTAQAKMPFAYRGMAFAAKILAMTGLDLIFRPGVLEEVRREFNEMGSTVL